MNFLGFYIGGHDSNVSLSDANGNVIYYKLERLIQSKHKKGSLEWVRDICDKQNFKPAAICFSDGNRNNLGICQFNELWTNNTVLNELFDVPSFCVDHHYAHILSAWPLIAPYVPIPLGICIDGRGDHQIKSSVIENPFDLSAAKFVYNSVDASYCLLFNKIGRMMELKGGELDFAGKIMGACAYGKIHPEYVDLCKHFLENNILDNILSVPYKKRSIAELCKKRDQDFFDWLASFNQVIFDEINGLFQNWSSPNTNIVYVGGCAQNTVFNEKLCQNTNLIIPPHCYDGGISLGCIKFLSLYYNKPLMFSDFPFEQAGGDVGFADSKTIEIISELLKEGKIVGWCQGKGEIGPRALGHRSILMNPAIKNGKDIINMRVKKREAWRPFAASILKKDAEKIMKRERNCPYMLHAVQIDLKWKNLLPSVIHEDNTCRFQTVEDSDQLHSFYSLITSFKKKTGIPGVLNTSFNIAGKPIANSLDDILEAFEYLDLDVLCVGNQIIYKK